MANKCFGLHHLIKGKILHRTNYGEGMIWCQTCRIAFNPMGLKCPCCKMDVRLRPRNGKYHRKIIETVGRY